LWRARRELSAWFLVVFIGTGILALGLAVNNVGALYRFRYPFWILMVILGAGGIDLLRKILLRKRPAVT
jgi:phosphoglycerol transferase MdoB-like AlkP superfamily enzyme